jgi:hypothetical protein
VYGHDSKPSRVYAFKALAPAGADLDTALEQLRLAHRYGNALVEIERRRRGRVDDLLRARAPAVAGLAPQLEAIEAEVEAAEAVVKRARIVARRRDAATPEQRAALAGLRTRRKDLRAALKEARAAAFADGTLRADLDAIGADADAEQRAARAECGVFWGTYLFIEQCHKDDRKGAPPRFKPWRGEGALAVQLQHGLPWPGVLLCGDTRLRVEIRPHGPAADPASARSRTKARADLYFRVGSIGRAPLWCRTTVHVHRRPPADAAVKWAYLHRRKVGPRALWEFRLVLACDDWDRDDWAPSGAVGVDLNWRSLPAGLRVATSVGSDDESEHLFIPREWLRAWHQVESLRSIRDRNFDPARDRLAAWLAAAVAVPDWLRERTEHLARWRSAGRLSALVWHWKDARFEGDADIYECMEAWRKQDKHLHVWEASLHRKACRRRDDLYRKFAARLSRRYHTVHLEDIDYQALRVVPPPDVADEPYARLYARIAAPGRLAAFLRERFAAAVKVPAAYTTLRCSACAREGWETLWECDTAAKVMHTCPVCGYTLDQDVNAATNLLNTDPGAVPAGVAHAD